VNARQVCHEPFDDRLILEVANRPGNIEENNSGCHAAHFNDPWNAPVDPTLAGQFEANAVCSPIRIWGRCDRHIHAIFGHGFHGVEAVSMH
jgi:hypothetical protein